MKSGIKKTIFLKRSNDQPCATETSSVSDKTAAQLERATAGFVRRPFSRKEFRRARTGAAENKGTMPMRQCALSKPMAWRLAANLFLYCGPCILICLPNSLLAEESTVAAWGNNTYGQSSAPVDLTNATAIAGGGSHSLALKRDGTVVAWGWNGFGQADVP